MTTIRGLLAPLALACAAAALMPASAGAATADAAAAAKPAIATAATADGDKSWVGSWASSPVPPNPSGLSAGVNDRTLREVVHLSQGGAQLRVRLSNVFGSAPLTINAADVAPDIAGAQTSGHGQPLMFGGQASTTIPAGGEEWSDPVELQTHTGSDVAVSLYFQAPSGPLTWHPLATTTSYIANGNHAADQAASAFSSTSTSWFVLDGLDVRAPTPDGAVVAFGDSITDGAMSTPGANMRYPDDLARRLLATDGRRAPAVLNEGISGNRLLTDAGSSGVRASTRFQRDALDQPGVRDVIILEGINDIGHNLGPAPGSPATAADIIAALQQLARRAHERGLRVIGATLTPFAGSKYDTPEAQQKRLDVNAWIRTTPSFDAVVDFDAVTRDPSDPLRYLPRYDSGDHLHPDDQGYAAMANAIDLAGL